MPEPKPTVLEWGLWMVIAALALAIGGPRLLPPSSAHRDKQLLASVLLLRNAVAQFHEDTGLWPCTLTDLTAPRPPRHGVRTDGHCIPISAGAYAGPYLLRKGGIGATGLPSNPLVSRQDPEVAHHWRYIGGRVESAVDH